MVKNRNIRRSRRSRRRRMCTTRRSRTVSGGKTPTHPRKKSSRVQASIIGSKSSKPNCKGMTFDNYGECIDNCSQHYCNQLRFPLPKDAQDNFLATHRFSPHKSRHPSKDSYKNQNIVAVPRNWKLLPD